MVELGGEGVIREGDRSDPYIFEAGGLDGAPEKSLLVLRCKFDGNSGICFSVLISSNVGVAPRYQAAGEDGVASSMGLPCSGGNIGFGLCMLPSEPLRRRLTGIPKPGLVWPGLLARISPNKGFRGGMSLTDGRKSGIPVRCVRGVLLDFGLA